jgi:hypothetical protein
MSKSARIYTKGAQDRKGVNRSTADVREFVERNAVVVDRSISWRTS